MCSHLLLRASPSLCLVVAALCVLSTALHLPICLHTPPVPCLQAGMCDGMTYEEVAEKMPGEFALRRQDKLRYRWEGRCAACGEVCRGMLSATLGGETGRLRRSFGASALCGEGARGSRAVCFRGARAG